MSKASLFSILFLFLFAISSSAQVKQLKLYGSTNILKSPIQASPVWVDTDLAFQHKHFSIAYLFSKKDTRIHQIELHRLILKQDDSSGMNRRSFELNFQYNMTNLLWQSDSEKLRFYYGPMARLFVGGVSANPATTALFPSNKTIAGLTIGMLGELNWKISSKAFLIARLPIEFLSFSTFRNRIENPVLTSVQQVSGGLDFEFLGSNIFPSLGVGFDL